MAVNSKRPSLDADISVEIYNGPIQVRGENRVGIEIEYFFDLYRYRCQAYEGAFFLLF